MRFKAAVFAVLMSSSVSAQDYPARPVSVIGTTPAGISVDLITRFMGERVKEITGQPWVIDNKPGALGSIAAKVAASSKPDGYTLFVCPSGAMSANQYLQKGLPYDPVKDFALIARLFRIDFVLMVNSEKLPAKSVAELTDILKAKQGRVSYGYFSASMQALGEQYLNIAGIKGAPAAYKNLGQMMSELEGGDYDFAFTSIDYALAPNRKLRPLAIGSERRSQLLPNVPTMSEAGLSNALPLTSWFGLCAPAGVPDLILQKLEGIVLEIVNGEKTRAFMRTYGAEPFPGNAATFALTQRETSESWVQFLKFANISAQ